MVCVIELCSSASAIILDWTRQPWPLQENNCQWQARRSGGEWFTTVLKSIAQIHDDSVVGRFISCDVPRGRERYTVDEPWLLEEKTRLQDFWTLLSELAAARCWSQIWYSMSLPNPGVLHENRDSAQLLLNYHRKIWNAVLTVESAVKGPKLPKAVRNILKQRLLDISCNGSQLARELFLEYTRLSWDASNKELLYMTQQVFGGPCQTKYHLEDLFAHLAKSQKASHQSTTINKFLVEFSQTNIFVVILQ